MIVISSSSTTIALAVLATLAYGAAAGLHLRAHTKAAHLAGSLAWLLHGITLVASFALEPPHFGFGPALSITAWLVLTIYGIEYLLLPQFRPHWLLAVIGAAALLTGVAFPGPALHERQTPLMVLHLGLGIASYGLFAAAVVHGWLMRASEKSMRLAGGSPAVGIPLLSLERLMFRFTTAGFVLLTLTLLAGLLFGEQIYGQAWFWQHKQVFAVLAWLCFAGLLIARWRVGVRGKTALRLLNLGAILLLLAYVGSRFVREVIL